MILIKCDKLNGYKLTAHYLVDMKTSNIWGEISVPSPLTPSMLNDLERSERYILSLKFIYKSLLFGVYSVQISVTHMLFIMNLLFDLLP